MGIMRLLTFSRFSKDHPESPLGGLRWMAFNEDHNGAKALQVFPKNGRRRYINIDRYYLHIELQNTGELDTVVELIQEAKKEGKYLAPEDAVAQIRQLGVARIAVHGGGR